MKKNAISLIAMLLLMTGCGGGVAPSIEGTVTNSGTIVDTALYSTETYNCLYSENAEAVITYTGTVDPDYKSKTLIWNCADLDLPWNESFISKHVELFFEKSTHSDYPECFYLRNYNITDGICSAPAELPNPATYNAQIIEVIPRFQYASGNNHRVFFTVTLENAGNTTLFNPQFDVKIDGIYYGPWDNPYDSGVRNVSTYSLLHFEAGKTTTTLEFGGTLVTDIGAKSSDSYLMTFKVMMGDGAVLDTIEKTVYPWLDV